jgi:hypothetical protein
MLAFQQVPLDAPPSIELARRVESWTFWTVFRTPLDVISFGCYLFALARLAKGVEAPSPRQAAAAHS